MLGLCFVSGRFCKIKNQAILLLQVNSIQLKNFEIVLEELLIKFKWKGKGINSRCYDNNGNCIVECDKKYFRPLEVDSLLGDSKKARKTLNWKPKYKIKDLVKEMVYQENLQLSEKLQLSKYD